MRPDPAQGPGRQPGARTRVLAAAAVSAVALLTVAAAALAAKDATLLVSRTNAGVKGSAASAAPAISADGRYIAFESDAQLVTEDTDAIRDVYVRDTQDGTTTLVSRRSGASGAKGDAASTAASISADGQRVAFQTTAKLDADDGDATLDVYVRDLATATTLFASRATLATGVEVNQASRAPAISADGRWVAFASDAQLHADDADLITDVYRRDLQTQTTELVSRAGAGVVGSEGTSDLPAISADGRFVSFESSASNLTADDPDTDRDILVRDVQGATTTLASRATGATGVKGNNNSHNPTLSADGRYVAFDSQANNLDPADLGGVPDVYVRDLQASTTTLVSRNSSAVKANATSVGPAISDNGRYVAFESTATNLDDDGDATRDVFERDLGGGTTTLVSRAGGEDGVKGNGASTAAAISSGGRFVAYDSLATNLDGDDMDATRDVYARDVLGPPDTTAPQITVPAPITVEATGASGAVVSYAAMATDDVAVQSFVCVPDTGATFPIGLTTVTCSASDTSDNTAMATFAVTVADTTAPAITVPANVTAEATGPAGAVVSYAQASATDAVAVQSVGCVPASGATFPVGPTTVTCSATDTSDNHATATFVVTVADTVAPAITVPADVVAPATSPAGAVVSFAVSAADAVGGATVACVPAPGATFAIGTTTVACSASDGAGNHASGTFAVTVTPLPPVPPPPAFAPPAAPPPPSTTTPAPRSTAKLSLQRAAIVRATRMLDVFAGISSQASGRIAVELRCAGRRLRFTAPIDAARARVSFRKRIPRQQAAAGTCLLTLTYAGDPDTRSQTVRLRTGRRAARLTLKRPRLAGGRLRASGTVVAAARGSVRVQLEYDYRDVTRRPTFSARIVRGAWKLDVKLSDAILAEIAARTGTVHSYTLFTGYLPLRIRGEMKSSQVLGEP